MDNQTILYLNITIKSACVMVCKSGLQGVKAEHVLESMYNTNMSSINVELVYLITVIITGDLDKCGLISKAQDPKYFLCLLTLFGGL